ncbi:MAG TPA: hypothetical protein VN796_07770 [Acidimicrobiales bacterium]|nr:hypothetical protein [Acidimicrobiales bacterium]
MPRTHDAPPTSGPPPNGSGSNGLGHRTPGSTVDGNGHTPPPPGDAPGVPRRPPGPSTRPAFIVLGVAVVVLLFGFIGALVTGGGSTPTAPVTSLPTAKGAGITAVPGRHALSPIVIEGQPPDDILAAVALPKGAAAKPGSGTNNGIGLYDHSLSFTVGASEQRVIGFFRAELPALKWQIVSQGPAPKGTPGYRIVGQHPSSDGYEWEIGVTVAPTTFGTGSAAAESTSFALRLFAVTDS